jgi:hypothetical protein
VIVARDNRVGTPGTVLDSTFLIAAERRNATAAPGASNMRDFGRAPGLSIVNF